MAILDEYVTEIGKLGVNYSPKSHSCWNSICSRYVQAQQTHVEVYCIILSFHLDLFGPEKIIWKTGRYLSLYIAMKGRSPHIFIGGRYLDGSNAKNITCLTLTGPLLSTIAILFVFMLSNGAVLPGWKC